MDIPLQTIIDRIKEQKGLSEEEIETRIKKKLDELAGLISKEGAAHIVANELGIQLIPDAAEVTISKLLAGMRNVDLVAKVRQKYEIRTFSNERRSGKVGNMLISDATGTIRLVLWNDQADQMNNLKAGDVIKIKGGYSRENNGRVELHLGDAAKIYINPEGVTVDADITTKPQAETKKIVELGEADSNVNVTATIVQVFDPRFFPACPECKSRATEQEGVYSCATHGTITPNFNYVMNVYLDDGSDNIRCVLWKEQAAKLIGKTQEEILQYKDEPTLFESIKTDLLGLIVNIRGRVNKNETMGRLELVAYDIETDAATPPQENTEGREHPGVRAGVTSTEPSEEEQAPLETQENKAEKEIVAEESLEPEAETTPKNTPTTTPEKAVQEEAVTQEKPAEETTKEPAQETVAQEQAPVTEAKAALQEETSETKKPAPQEDELFTLEDLEDLEDLDD